MARGRRCCVCGSKKKLKQVSGLGAGGRIQFGVFCERCAKHIEDEVRKRMREVGPWLFAPDDLSVAEIGPFKPHCQDSAEAMDEAVSQLAMPVRHCFLWEFPESDYSLWSDLQHKEHGTAACTRNNTYQEYQDNLHRLKERLEAAGHQVILVKATVQMMIDACKEIGVPYSTQGRVQAVQVLGNRQLRESGPSNQENQKGATK